MHFSCIPVAGYFKIRELGPVDWLVPGAMPSVGMVELEFTVGSGIFVPGKVTVGTVTAVVGAVVLEPVGSVVGALLLQAQAQRENAVAMPKMKIPIFFILLLLSV